MKAKDIFEGVSSDVAAYRLAENAYYKILDFLYKRRDIEESEWVANDISIATVKGKEIPAVWMSVFIGWPSPFTTVLLAFDQDDEKHFGIGGYASPIKNIGDGDKQLVVINCFGNSLKDIHNSLARSSCKNTVVHELVHVLDFKRMDGGVAAIRSSLQHSKSDGSPSNDYWNDVLELNAYFHNLAGRLLSNLAFMRDHSPEDSVIILDPMPDTFEDYLKQTTTRLMGSHKRFWAALRQRNKRRIISRLKALYDEHQKLWAEAEKSASSQ